MYKQAERASTLPLTGKVPIRYKPPQKKQEEKKVHPFNGGTTILGSALQCGPTEDPPNTPQCQQCNEVNALYNNNIFISFIYTTLFLS